MRRMHEASVTGIFVDHNDSNSRSGWSELQAYLIVTMAQDVSLDAEGLIKEFTDHQYGPASSADYGRTKPWPAER
jgi:hypothetical protein